MDDWATRKGHSYGTILIDLERGTVIDLLPGRDSESLKRWLAANPQVEVITRDRWPSYIDAATQAAPQARQVADRFHLLRNVREAVEQMLARHGDAIRDASREVDTAAYSPTPVEPDASPRPPSPADAGREAKRQQRRERFERVKDLTSQGYSSRAIARMLGMSIRAVLKYRRRDHVPDWHKGRVGPT